MIEQPHIALRLCRARDIATLVPKPLSRSRRGVLVMSAFLLAACAPPDRGTNTPLPPPSAAFDSVDADSDGSVTVEEWHAVGNTVFTSLDTDSGGSISPAEIEAGFDSLDLNRDGVIDKGEADIPSLDTDGDGVISRAEWSGDIFHENLDADRDGHVSRAEFDTYHGQTFATHDSSGNSRIDRIELSPEGKRFTLFRF